MELILITPESSEWEYIWNWLENHPINKDLPDPSEALNNNHKWEYYGSLRQDKDVIHLLRHNHHPVTNNVLELKLKASGELDLTQIKKTIRL